MADTEFKYDVFISYSHKDEEWADKVLCQRLDGAGLKVCIDYRDFEVGKMALLNMQDSVKQSRHVVLVLTRNWLDSEWSLFEALMAGTKDPAGLQKKLIPLLCEDGIQNDINDFIAMRTWVDFTRKDREDIAWKQLFTALGKPEAFQPSNMKPETGSRDTWHLAHPYPMPPNFTGRVAELQMLDDWLADNTNRLFILRALGGFGKSALSWQWINTHVDPAAWTRLVWWSFYEGDASFEHFVAETLKYLGHKIPESRREQVDDFLKALQAQKVLLVMDGFERALRAYSSMSAAYQGDSELPSPNGSGVESGSDCVDLNAEFFLKSVCSLPGLKSKVLMTTRLAPRAVKPRGEFMLGCREEELTAMQKADAVAFFRKQRIKGTHAEIEVACEPYGYHPLSLRLLAGRILKDFANPGDISVAQKLKMDGDIVQQKHHVLKVSYNSLPPHEQQLLSTIACFRSPVEHKTLGSIAKKKATLDQDLRDLLERGLLHFDEKNKKFDLHPIVRRFAYDRFTASQRTNAHVILVVYFEAVPEPPKIEKLEDLAPVIELYHHMVRAGRLDEAIELFRDRLHSALYYQFGAYQLIVELIRALFPDGEDKPPRLKKESDQAWTLNSLANSYALSGQPRRAVPLFEMTNDIYENKTKNMQHLAIGLGNVADDQLKIGALSAAERGLRRSIDLCREIADEHMKAIGHRELGRVLLYRGEWNASEQELRLALSIFEKEQYFSGQGVTWSYLALWKIIESREHKSAFDAKEAISCINSALHCQNEWTKRNYPIEREKVRNFWLLGAAYCMNNELTLTEENLSKALNLCRQINMVDHEANILLDLARLHYARGDFQEAQEKASEALAIAERSGYVLTGADVNLLLAELALAEIREKRVESSRGKELAKQYAETALRLAHCDDGPPYHYKVAYEEAERFLRSLK